VRIGHFPLAMSLQEGHGFSAVTMDEHASSQEEHDEHMSRGRLTNVGCQIMGCSAHPTSPIH
jgi:hypothetical protein